MQESIKAQKKALRQLMLEKRAALSLEEQQTFSTKICEQLWEIVIQNEVKVIHSYLPMRSEVDVSPFLQQCLEYDITIVTPKTLKSRQMQHLILTDLSAMENGIFGTYHPNNALEYHDHYDLIIVAGLAFDKECYRVGYGGGYYDTFLTSHPTATKVGVCYPFQLLESVPIESHDCQLDRVVT